MPEFSDQGTAVGMIITHDSTADQTGGKVGDRKGEKERG